MKSFSPLVVALCSLLGFASASISAQNLTTLTLYEQYAAAAYCDTNTKGRVPLKFNCAFGNTNCSLPQAAGATIVKNFATIALDVEGFVAVDTTNKLIVVSFRGSCGFRSSSNDASAVFQAAPVPGRTITNCGGNCLVEPGFYNAWLQVRDVVLPAVSSQLKLHTGFTVVTTGHSLGGAISHYAGYEIRVANKNVSVDVASYGSPLTGNQDWVNALQAQAKTQGRNVRVQHNGDFAPFAPLLNVYKHTFPVFFISVRNTTPVTTDDVSPLNDASTIPVIGLTNFDPQGHSFYIGNISSCNLCNGF